MAVRIRPAHESDRERALALAHRLEEGVAPWRDPSAVASAVEGWVLASVSGIGDDERACFVADDDGEVVGFLAVETTRHWSGTTEAYIGELMVAESAQGRGIGRALVHEAMAWGRSQGCTRVALETGAANSNALAFYEALRFDHDEVRLSRAL